MSEISFRWGIPILDEGMTQVPNLFFDHYTQVGVTRSEFLFILHLARYKYESPTSECRPSLETIAAQMGYKVRQVQRLRESLEEKEFLVVVPRPGLPNLYNFSGLSQALMAGVSSRTPPVVSPKTPKEEELLIIRSQTPAKNSETPPAPEPAGELLHQPVGPIHTCKAAAAIEELRYRPEEIPVPHGTYEIGITAYTTSFPCPCCEIDVECSPYWKRSHPFRKEPHCAECGAPFRIFLESDHGDIPWAIPKTGAVIVKSRLVDAFSSNWLTWLAGICKGEELDLESFKGMEQQVFWSTREYERAKELWKGDPDGFLRELVWAWQMYKGRKFRKTEWIGKAIASYHTKEMKRNTTSAPQAARPTGTIPDDLGGEVVRQIQEAHSEPV